MPIAITGYKMAITALKSKNPPRLAEDLNCLKKQAFIYHVNTTSSSLTENNKHIT